MSTAGRLQDCLHMVLDGYDFNYGSEHEPGIVEKFGLTLEQDKELFEALFETMWGFVSAEQSKYRRIGADEALKTVNAVHWPQSEIS